MNSHLVLHCKCLVPLCLWPSPWPRLMSLAWIVNLESVVELVLKFNNRWNTLSFGISSGPYVQLLRSYHLPFLSLHPSPISPCIQSYFLSFYSTLFPSFAFSLRKATRHTVKKGLPFFRSQPGCHLPNSPWAGIISIIFPSRESLVSDIPTGEGKIVNSVYLSYDTDLKFSLFFLPCRSLTMLISFFSLLSFHSLLTMFFISFYFRLLVQGDPDLETSQSLYFSLSRKYTFRPRSKPSDMPIRIYNYMYTPPHLSPLPYCPQNRGKVNIKTNDYSPLKKG